MRHIFILLSILFLSSPVIEDNHKGETLYGWGKCCDYVWKGFGDKETHSKYTGDVGNEVPNGFGIMIFPNGNKYIGGWKDGRWNGQGTHTYPDGSKFEGDYKDDWEWNGTQYDKNGNIKYKYVNGKQIKQ